MYKYLLWLLKLGTIINLYFFYQSLSPSFKTIDPNILLPAQLLFLVSAYRCFYPVNYTSHAVLHDSIFSSVFITRFFATFVEIAYIYQFSYIIRVLNAGQISIVDQLSWLMAIQVVVSQFFVWAAILTGMQKLYFYEELGWAVIFIINTFLSLFLILNLNDLGGKEILIRLNLVFGALYLPWQWIHLSSIKNRAAKLQEGNKIDLIRLKDGLKKSINFKKPSIEPHDWGGIVGMMWMVGYWVILIPGWMYIILINFSN